MFSAAEWASRLRGASGNEDSEEMRNFKIATFEEEKSYVCYTERPAALDYSKGRVSKIWNAVKFVDTQATAEAVQDLDPSMLSKYSGIRKILLEDTNIHRKVVCATCLASEMKSLSDSIISLSVNKTKAGITPKADNIRAHFSTGSRKECPQHAAVWKEVNTVDLEAENQAKQEADVDTSTLAKQLLNAVGKEPGTTPKPRGSGKTRNRRNDDSLLYDTEAKRHKSQLEETRRHHMQIESFEQEKVEETRAKVNAIKSEQKMKLYKQFKELQANGEDYDYIAETFSDLIQFFPLEERRMYTSNLDDEDASPGHVK